MKGTTRERKKAIRGIEDGCGRQWVVEQMHQLLVKGKQGFYTCIKEIVNINGFVNIPVPGKF